MCFNSFVIFIFSVSREMNSFPRIQRPVVLGKSKTELIVCRRIFIAILKKVILCDAFFMHISGNIIFQILPFEFVLVSYNTRGQLILVKLTNLCIVLFLWRFLLPQKRYFCLCSHYVIGCIFIIITCYFFVYNLIYYREYKKI